MSATASGSNSRRAGSAPSTTTTSSRKTDGGYLYVEIETPAYDALGDKAVLTCNVSGPTPSPQNIGRSPRDKARERRQYDYDRSQAEHDRMNRTLGKQSIMRSLLVGARFEIPMATKARLSRCDDDAVLHRVAMAFGAGGLECADDLVREADLYEFLGIEPPTDAPRP